MSKSTSNSQYGQDLWVIEQLQGLRNGFFLEMGAGDGIWISNTLLLEKDYAWTGILIEPTGAFERLVRNRPNATCLKEYVANEEKEVTFFEVFDRGQASINQAAEGNTLLSGVREDITEAQGDETNSEWGQFQQAYKSMARPLEVLLDENNAPTVIDYFSLDVEGYEYEVLRSFPFHRYSFRLLGIERPSLELDRLLRQKGYAKRGDLGEDIMYSYSPSMLRRVINRLRRG